MPRREMMYRIRLTEDQKRNMMNAIDAFWLDEFNEKTGLIKQQVIFDFFMEQLAPDIYNQALEDARAWYKQSMENVEDEYYSLFKS